MKFKSATLAIIFALCSPITFAAPTCIDAASDSDGDGWGWENNTSCLVAESNCIDTDGDGWGWDGTGSCPVEQSTDINNCIDTDGDGWGWDGTASCLIEPVTAVCIDTDGDGYGWDGTASCIATDTDPEELPVDDPVTNVCIDTAPLNDTWGWDGTSACRLAPVLTPQDTSAIAGVYTIPEDGYTVYIEFSADGFYTVYDSETDVSDCFTVFGSESTEEVAQFRPLGGNLYELYSYELYNGTLYEYSEEFEIFVTDTGALSLTYTDYYYDYESGTDVTETITDVLPAVTDISIDDLVICENTDRYNSSSAPKLNR